MVCTLIVNDKLRTTITLNYALHGSIQVRGTGTGTMEENMAQQFAVIVHKPLLQIFIDVWKAYGYLDIGVCMEILSTYGLGTNIQRLLQR